MDPALHRFLTGFLYVLHGITLLLWTAQLVGACILLFPCCDYELYPITGRVIGVRRRRQRNGSQETRSATATQQQGQREAGELRIVVFSNECAICSNEIKDGERCLLLKCSHMCHYGCVNQWSKIKPACPLCRTAGDTAFVLSSNSVLVPVLYLSLGVIVSPSNPSNSNPEIYRQIQLYRPAIAFATLKTAHKVPSNSLLHGMVLLMMSQEGEFPRVEVFQSNPAAILCSSGTTGRVKGVVLTHRNIISGFAGAYALRRAKASPAVALCTVPYFHTYGFIYSVRAVAFGGVVVSMERFDFRLMMRAIEEYRVTNAALAPPVIISMLNNSGVMEGYDLSSLEVVSSGGSQLPVVVAERFKREFPQLELTQAYGLTEASGGVSRTLGSEECQVLGSTGRLDPNFEAKIVDPETGIALPPFKQGELRVRGPSIMKGYVDDEEATATSVDSEGWLRTGDLCYFDNQGLLFVVDRIKDLIKYKGYQVAPAGLEDVLQSHPDIAEAAVVPYPDEEAGEIPMALVVRRSGSKVAESEIKDFVAKQLLLVAPYKRIRRISFINEIPKNATGKVMRRELRKLAFSGVASKL
ncbi:hypothetical protein RJ639_008943 [Escallonia herrerae]|uniref:RING-type domain-containing protein n=1 Tax=Escallonia herrerae TaxID=1293975 RepID=A0AA88VUG6_9ASTE|nr:hypothetical protein RJ639_008943 [Escallonia herrerae]